MPIDPNRWTLKTQEAVNAAMDAARQGSAPEVTPDHPPAALVDQSEGVVTPLLQKVGIDPRHLRATIQERLGRLPRAFGAAPGLGRDLRDVLERADAARVDLRDDYVSTEHLVLAMAALVGATREELLQALQSVR